jgi:hypothetical protein
MALVDIVATAFAHTATNGTHQIALSRRKCLKFATSVGISHLARGQNAGQAHLAMASYRAMAVKCCLDFGQQQLQMFGEFQGFENTERANLAYWIGMTFAGIAADRVLGVPRLLHVSKLNKYLKSNNSSRSLADLAGQGANNTWHIIEAKARSSAPTPKNRAEWKAQAATVASVNGTAISTGSYCFALLGQPVSCELADPPRRRQRPVDLRLNPDELGARYYQPYIEFLGSGATAIVRDGRGFVVKPISYDPVELDYVYIGLDRAVRDAIKKGEAVPFVRDEFEGPDIYVGRDGVAVVTSATSCDLK